MSVAAGAPGPIGSGAYSANPTTTAIAVATPPRLRLRHAESRMGAAYRNGFSMNRSVRTAKPSESKIPASANSDLCPVTGAIAHKAMKSTGQCQRYQE